MEAKLRQVGSFIIVVRSPHVCQFPQMFSLVTPDNLSVMLNYLTVHYTFHVPVW